MLREPHAPSALCSACKAVNLPRPSPRAPPPSAASSLPPFFPHNILNPTQPPPTNTARRVGGWRSHSGDARSIFSNGPYGSLPAPRAIAPGESFGGLRERSGGFESVREASRRFGRLQEGSGGFEKVREASTRFGRRPHARPTARHAGDRAMHRRVASNAPEYSRIFHHVSLSVRPAARFQAGGLLSSPLSPSPSPSPSHCGTRLV